MTFSCNEIQDNLLFHVEGETTEIPSTSIEEHLESCDQCRERADSIQTLNHMMTSLPAKKLPETEDQHLPLALLLSKTPQKSLPEEFEQDTWRAIRWQRRPVSSKITRARAWRFAQSLAAAAIVVIITAIGYNSMERKPTYENYLKIDAKIEEPLYYISLKDRKLTKDRAVSDFNNMNQRRNPVNTVTEESSPLRTDNLREGKAE